MWTALELLNIAAILANAESADLPVDAMRWHFNSTSTIAGVTSQARRGHQSR
jgi:hypothetical protein